MTSEKIGIAGSLRARFNDPLRRSADALIIGTGLTSVLGLAFWALAARWLPTSAVGIGVALMSTVALLANFATLGMNNGLIRFLPAAGSGTARIIMSCYAFCAGAAMFAAVIFLLGQPLWAEKLGFLRDNPVAMLVFVVGTAIWVLYVLQDQVLIGLRRTGWVPIQNGLASVFKIALLPLFAGAATWAIFAATMIPALLAVLLITALALRYARQAAARDSRPAKEMRVPISSIVRFAASDHLATMLWFATNDVLTLIVLQVAGAEASAYWYIANAIGESLYLIVSNVGSVLIAESVHDPAHATAYARRALLHGAQLVLPAAILGIVFAPFVLRLMGPHYAENATSTLQFILASAIPHLIVGISVSTARVRGNMRAVVGVYAFISISTWVGGWYALHTWGLAGIGLAILVIHSITAVFLLLTGRTGLWDNERGWRSLVDGAGRLHRSRRTKRKLERTGLSSSAAHNACGVPKARGISWPRPWPNIIATAGERQ